MECDGTQERSKPFKGVVFSHRDENQPENRSEKKKKMKKQRMIPIDVVDLEGEGDGLCFRPTSGIDGNTRNDPISVEQHGEDRDLELAVKASLLAPQNEEGDLELAIRASVLSQKEEGDLELALRASLLNSENFVDRDRYDKDSRVLNFKPAITPRSRRKPFINSSLTGPGQSSKSKAVAAPVLSQKEERDLELALRASLLTSENFVDRDRYDEDSRVLNFKPAISPRNRRKPFINSSLTGPGQSSKSKAIAAPSPSPSPPPSPPFLCEICVEPKSQNESFKIKGCSHSYCTDCMTKFVASKLQDNIRGIGCPVPTCGGLLEPEDCRPILPPEVFDRWGDALCEGVILGSQKFYCPFKDCSALLIDDGEQQVKESECPNCFRLFCAQCKVPWHTGIECAEFQELHKHERWREGFVLLNLAQNQKWARCPQCRIVVERIDGCDYLRCRCGYSFCCKCGGPSCPNSHVCPRCNNV